MRADLLVDVLQECVIGIVVHGVYRGKESGADGDENGEGRRERPVNDGMVRG